MFSGFRMFQPTSSVQAHQNRDGLQAVMGFKGVSTAHTAENDQGPREVFDMKTIKMPKMVVKNAPTINPWYGLKH